MGPNFHNIWLIATCAAVFSVGVALPNIFNIPAKPIPVKIGDCFVLGIDLESWEEKTIVKVDIIGKKKYHYRFWSEKYGWMNGGSDNPKDRFSKHWEPIDCPDDKKKGKEIYDNEFKFDPTLAHLR